LSQQSGHLSEAEIRQCANTSPGGCPQETEAHLSECEYCLERLLRWQSTQLKLLETAGMRHEPYPDCPGEELVREVAAEIAPPEIARSTLQHISQCDHCGPLLKSYREAFSEERLPEIEAVLGQMPSAGEKARRKQAKEIAAKLKPNVTETNSASRALKWPFWTRLVAWSAPLAAVVLLSVLQGPALYANWKLRHTEKLVAEGYAEQRSTEMRLTGVEFGPYKKLIRKLGPGDGSESENESPALLNARSFLNGELRATKNPGPQWQQIDGRIALLQGYPEGAEKALRRALALQNSPSLQIDIAATYFERDDFSKAIDLLKAVGDDKNANDHEKSTALFDLAIAYERSDFWDSAIDTWKRFLEREKSGPWADEARRRLTDAEKKVTENRKRSHVVYRDPARFLAEASNTSVQQDLEDYLEIALTAWLPRAAMEPESVFFLQANAWLTC
jgi:tetratricopeptide (TPR) repeat protein